MADFLVLAGMVVSCAGRMMPSNSSHHRRRQPKETNLPSSSAGGTKELEGSPKHEASPDGPTSDDWPSPTCLKKKSTIYGRDGCDVDLVPRKRARVGRSPNALTRATRKRAGQRLEDRDDTAEAHSITPSPEKKHLKKRNPFWWNGENHSMAARAHDATTLVRGVTPFDLASKKHDSAVPEYVTDIFQRLYAAENRHAIQPYTQSQARLTSEIRYVVISWLNKAHFCFQLVPETLHLSIYIVDSFCSLQQVEPSEFLLVAAAALFIASKYEDLAAPELSALVKVCGELYTKLEVLDMEQEVCAALAFQFTVPTGIHFLKRYLFLVRASPMLSHASHYYLERALLLEPVLEYRPSVMAAAAVNLALHHPNIERTEIENADAMMHLLEQYCCPSACRFKSFRRRVEHITLLIVQDIVSKQTPCPPGIWSAAESSSLAYWVTKKFSKARYGHVSLALPNLSRLLQLPPRSNSTI